MIITPAPSPTRSVVRAACAAASMTAAASVILLAAPAQAGVPEGWSDPAPVDTLEAIALLVGGPLALFLLVGLAVALPSLVKGERVGLPGSTPESEWFGGPREGLSAADRVAAAELEKGAADSGTGGTGGARGQW
ncbi:hypothetical protein [Nocardioides donggukensis]|uniref:Uncharacterized protein n=1 Tax=Nocardioides donggukensis TaxID=2774019 RepID=A0A927K4Q4_9ACTN|nr:hypothetical protein [Nocardioides donggukensis]MBD8868898.1 hypothetical protein [Nocardioides donggukensis]